MILIEQAVLKTLAYADVFDYPLTAKEIHRYLIFTLDTNLPGGVPERERRVSPGVVRKSTQSLLNQKSIKSAHDYYFLPDRSKLVPLRQKRKRISQTKFLKAQSLAQSLSHLPSVLGIYLTGALTMKNANITDDLDFFIITQANQLWTTRLKLNLYTDVHRLRRHPGQAEPQVADRICLNLWLDETALSLPKSKRNLYTAHEVVQALPLINKDHIYERFLHANRWVLRNLPNTRIPEIKYSSHTSSLIPRTSILENLAYHLQYAYMKRKISRETVTHHAAFFHPRNTTNYVMTQYRSRCTTLKLKP